MKIFVIDGHDAAGKTTLARKLAEATGARYIRPFAGESGRQLMAAYEKSLHKEVLAIGREAIVSQLQAGTTDDRMILDRGWLTVATLVPREMFAAGWDLWIPSALLWCDEQTTRQRLRARSIDDKEPDDWHAHFLAAYLERFTLFPGQVVRTDQLPQSDCLAELTRLFDTAAPFAFPPNTV